MKNQSYDENRVPLSIFELYNFLIFPVILAGPKVSSPKKIMATPLQARITKGLDN